MTSLSRYETPYDTHPEKVNHAKFDVCTSGSFGRDKKDKQKYRKSERIALNILDVMKQNTTRVYSNPHSVSMFFAQ